MGVFLCRGLLPMSKIERDLRNVAIVNIELGINSTENSRKFRISAELPNSCEILRLLRNQDGNSIREMFASVKTYRKAAHLSYNDSLFSPS
jgi:hypothetical protein